MTNVDAIYLIDVRDVVQHMKDKSYHDLGEAFESIFYMCFDIDESGKLKLLEIE